MRDHGCTEMLSIGQLARRAGVGIDTVRFYERRGLLPTADRLPSGYRVFSAQTERRLRFVRQAQRVGFTLEEIRELLALRIDRHRTCADVRALALAKLAETEDKLAQLEQIRSALATLVERCTGLGPATDCPLLETLTQED